MSLRKPPAFTPSEIVRVGNHLAICYQIIELGTQITSYKGEEKIRQQVQIGWEFALQKMADGRPFTTRKVYTWTMGDRGKLREHLEGWRGRPFTDADIGENGSFRIKNLLGSTCMLQMFHEGGWANLKNVTCVAEGTQRRLKTINPQVYVTLDEDFDHEAFENLHESVQDTIRKSPEYEEMIGEHPSADSNGQNPYGNAPTPDSPEVDNEDIPF